MRRKKSRKRREWNGFPSDGGWTSKRKSHAWVYGDGGKKVTACERKERQDTEAVFTDSTSVAVYPLLCNTKPTPGSGIYRILRWILCIVVPLPNAPNNRIYLIIHGLRYTEIYELLWENTGCSHAAPLACHTEIKSLSDEVSQEV